MSQPDSNNLTTQWTPDSSATHIRVDSESPDGSSDGRAESPSGSSFDEICSKDGDIKSERGTDSQMSGKRERAARDPASHRVIEKRRRDRMNNCLTNLSKLIPPAYLKKGRGRIEKTEIIEMAIRYMKHSQAEKKHSFDMTTVTSMSEKSTNTDEQMLPKPAESLTVMDRYREGFYDCIAEVLRFLAIADHMPVDEMLKVQMLDHLNRYYSQSAGCPVAKSDLTVDTKVPFTATPPKSHQFYSQFDNNNSKLTSSGDEPLNMSVKRPRAEYPQEIISQRGSQLRDILESRQQPPLLQPAANSQILFASADHQRQRQTAAETPKTSDLPSQPLNYSAKGPGAVPFPPAQKRILQCDSTCDPYSIPPAAYLAGLLSGNGPNSVSSSLQYPSSPSDTTSSGDSSEIFTTPTTTLVPIFALHPAGLFYVPLALPHCQLESAGYNKYSNFGSNGLSAMIQSCHPVTISVQFEMSGRGESNSPLNSSAVKRHGDEFLHRPTPLVGQKSFLPKSGHLPDPTFGQRQNDLIPPQSHFARTNVILAPASSTDNRQLRAQNY